MIGATGRAGATHWAGGPGAAPAAVDGHGSGGRHKAGTCVSRQEAREARRGETGSGTQEGYDGPGKGEDDGVD